MEVDPIKVVDGSSAPAISLGLIRKIYHWRHLKKPRYSLISSSQFNLPFLEASSYSLNTLTWRKDLMSTLRLSTSMLSLFSVLVKARRRSNAKNWVSLLLSQDVLVKLIAGKKWSPLWAARITMQFILRQFRNTDNQPHTIRLQTRRTSMTTSTRTQASHQRTESTPSSTRWLKSDLI